MKITDDITLNLDDIQFCAIRAQGAGGQNVNKVSSAIHLRFDIKASSLPDNFKEKLLEMSDSRMTNEGIIVIKAQSHRTQEKNKQDSIDRLITIIQGAIKEQKIRRTSKPSKSYHRKRMDSKTKQGAVKQMRKPPKF